MGFYPATRQLQKSCMDNIRHASQSGSVGSFHAHNIQLVECWRLVLALFEISTNDYLRLERAAQYLKNSDIASIRKSE